MFEGDVNASFTILSASVEATAKATQTTALITHSRSNPRRIL
jgi:hypothetical protein